MQGYYIKIGEKELGPFLTKSAAAAEAKELKGKGYDCKVVARTVSETQMFEHLGNPEAEVELDDDDELDVDELFKDDDDSDDDDSDDDDSDDDDSDDDDDDSGEPKPKKKDDKPTGEHGWFKSFGKVDA